MFEALCGKIFHTPMNNRSLAMERIRRSKNPSFSMAVQVLTVDGMFARLALFIEVLMEDNITPQKYSGSGRPMDIYFDGISPWCRWVIFRQKNIGGFNSPSAEDGVVGCLLYSPKGGVVQTSNGRGSCSFAADVMADDPQPLSLFLRMVLALRGLGKGLHERMMWALEPRGSMQMNCWGFVLRRYGLREGFSHVGIMDSSQRQVMAPEIKEQSQGEVYSPIFIRSLCGKSVCIQIRDTNTIQEVKSLF